MFCGSRHDALNYAEHHRVFVCATLSCATHAWLHSPHSRNGLPAVDMTYFRKHPNVAGSLLGLLAALPFFHLLRAGYYPCDVDLLPHIIPIRKFAASALADGYFPLWDSYIQCGQSLSGHPAANLFYPFFWLFLLGGGWFGFTIHTIVHYFFTRLVRLYILHYRPEIQTIASSIGDGNYRMFGISAEHVLLLSRQYSALAIPFCDVLDICRCGTSRSNMRLQRVSQSQWDSSEANFKMSS